MKSLRRPTVLLLLCVAWLGATEPSFGEPPSAAELEFRPKQRSLSEALARGVEALKAR